MLVALYIGDHATDGLMTRLGWWLTRLAQKGPYDNVTHMEAIHELHADGSVTIASASLRDGGVRPKRIMLDPHHWLIADVPSGDVERSKYLLSETNGQPYDWRGAAALFLPGSPVTGHWFCNQWVIYPYIRASATFSPAQAAAIVFSLGRDVTAQFFAERLQ